MKESTLVSVLIPTYNVEKYIEEAVNSILNQTYRNLEIIIIDDCSSDDTFNILKSMESKDKRIKLLRNKINSKIAVTLNNGLKIAKGKYIARMDGDDISALDRIEKKVQFLEDNISLDMVGCSLISIDIYNNKIGKSTSYSDIELLNKTIKYVSPLSHIWVAKKNVYDKLDGYRNISGVEDYDFLLRMKSLGFKFTNIEEYYGYFVRLGRDGNTISSYGIKQKKLRSYAYSLYKEREKNGSDSFDYQKLSRVTSTIYFLEKIHSYSSAFLFKSIKLKSQRKYLLMFFYLILSMISPYQVSYLLNKLHYSVIIKKYNK